MSDAAWLKGKHLDYDLFVIEVLVRRDRAGGLSSRRRLQDSSDENVAATLPSGGMAEGGWALLAEAARTEITLQLLVKLSNDPTFQEKLMGGPDNLEEIVGKLASDATALMQRELQELLPQIAREVTGTIRDGLRSETG